jgi:Lrp/AsnC family transcriptional regulator for asnA, asnC and gidA
MKINSLQVEIDGIDKEILRDLMEMRENPFFKLPIKLESQELLFTNAYEN